MKKEFSVENLELYKTVREFRRKYNSTVEIRTTELVADAKKIFEEFIADTATKQVNLPADVITNLKKIFTDSVQSPLSVIIITSSSSSSNQPTNRHRPNHNCHRYRHLLLRSPLTSLV